MHLFIHGFLGSKEDWDPLLSYLKIGTAIDLPLGVADIPKALHRQYPRADCLIGYSAGGRIALEMKARFADAYKKVIVISSHPGISNLTERQLRKARDERWIKLLETKPFEDFLKAWYEQELFEGFRSCKAFEQALMRRKKQNPHLWAHFMKTHGTSSRKCFDIDPTTAFVYGSLDLKYSSLYRSFNAYKIEGAGHVAHLEDPYRCALTMETLIHGND